MNVELMIKAKKINLNAKKTNFSELFEIMQYLEIQHEIKLDFSMIIKN